MDAALTKIIDTLFGALDLFRPWVVLYEYERGVMLRLGRFDRELGPGWHWRLPFRLEELRFLNVRKQTSSSWELTLTTIDDVTVAISFDYVIEIEDPRSVLLNVNDWQHVAYTACKISAARLVETSTVDEVLDEDFSARLRESAEAALSRYGVRLVELGLTDRCRTRAYRFYRGSAR